MIVRSCLKKVSCIYKKYKALFLKKSQLSFEYNDLEIIQKHYSDLLTKELPLPEKVEEKKEA